MTHFDDAIGITVIVGYLAIIFGGLWKASKTKPVKPVDPKYDPNWDIRRKSE